MKTAIEKIKSWLILIRLPNLFTVPGDPICGFLLSCRKNPDLALLFACIASLSAYIFGLIGNDIADIEEDKLSAPERPLPSGKISPTSAKIAKSFLFFFALLFSFYVSKRAGITTIFLLFFIILYNNFFKKNPLIGPILLASCRTLNLSLGAAVAGFANLPDYALNFSIFVCVYFVYIFGVSFAARNERHSDVTTFLTGTSLLSFSIFILLSLLSSKIVQIYKYTGLLAPAFYSGIIASIILLILLFSFWTTKIFHNQEDISSGIGKLLCGIILIQCIALSWNASITHSWIILALFPFAIFASRFIKGA